jgi:predicted DNA-binding transcriptional regulator AlpA
VASAKPVIHESVRGSEPARVPTMLTSKDVAQLLCVAPSTLCRWRQTGKGPRVYWLGAGSPRYREDDILEWLERMAA